MHLPTYLFPPLQVLSLKWNNSQDYFVVKKQTRQQSADLHQGGFGADPRSQDPQSEVRMTSKFTGYVLVKRYMSGKIFVKIQSHFWEVHVYEPNCEKMLRLAMLKNSSKISYTRIQKLLILPKNFYHFFLVQSCISDKIFMTISTAVFT